MNIKWQTSGNEYYPSETSQEVERLGKGVYSIRMTPTGVTYLARTQDEFTFGYKLYDIETNFVKRVATTWLNTTGNIGILLNGIKGTGKTVTAELICGEVGLPIILVDRPFKGLGGFLENVQQDCIVFFDEFEKVYGDNVSEEDDQDGIANGGSILSLMDGTSNKQHRRLFILTTNKPRVNANMLERPSRLRYIKQFGDLSLNAIIEIVDDLLVNKEFKSEVVKFIAQLNIITVDIVKAVINEVNIHNENPSEFEDIFNVTKKERRFDVYWLNRTDGKNPSDVFDFSVEIQPPWILDEDTDDADKIGHNLYFDHKNQGEITAVNGNEITVKNNGILDGKRADIERTFRLENRVNYHANFRDYAF
jgi:hypothetical protein